MEEISLPNKVHFAQDKANPYRATVTIEPFYPGYGHTVGNSLRRVLLSSLIGAAVTRVKIKGVDHEFTTISNMKEEVLQLILGLKQLRVRMHTDEPQRLILKAKGAKEVTGADIGKNAQVDIVNSDLVIATLTDSKAELEVEIVVEKGRSYLPVEARPHETEIGMISVDAIFTPVTKVEYKVESSRVGQRTDFDKLILDIETDGSVSVEQAVQQASALLVAHFSFLASFDPSEEKSMIENRAEEGGDADAIEEEGESKNTGKKR